MKTVSSSIVLLSILLPALAIAQQTPQSFADTQLPSLLAIYKDIHSHPELSGHEERTALLIAKELRAAGCQVTEHLGKYENAKLKGYGVVGVMKNGDGPIVLVRTDMDALPVEEETGLPYASKAVTKNDEGLRHHSVKFIRRGNNGGFEDAWMFEQHTFHFRPGNVDPAANDDVVIAALIVEEAIAVTNVNIARNVPALAHVTLLAIGEA